MRQFIQITAGRGPVECASVVTRIGAEIIKAIQDLGIINVDIVDYEEHNDFSNLFMSMVLGFESPAPEIITTLRNQWEGTIKYIATKNTLRPGHKRKNWFVGVNFFEELDFPEVSEKDIKYEAIRSSGNGGQNVNKVSSAIRATHIPTGLSVLCEESRDQPRNKEIAKERLLNRLREINLRKQDNQKQQIWNNHNLLERGNPKKTIKGEV